MEELAKWLLTLDAADVKPLGAVLALGVVSAWLLINEHLVLGVRYREKVAELDRVRESGETCATALETRRDEMAELRQRLGQTEFERDWYQRQGQAR